MTAVDAKPSFDRFIQIVRDQFPFSQITDEEIENFRNIYADLDIAKLRRVFKKARDSNSLAPLSFMTRQLGTSQPTFKQMYGRNSLREEKGTNWQAVYSRMDEVEAQKKQTYDAKHGKGAYDKQSQEDCEFIHKHFVYMDWINSQNDGKEPDELTKEDIEFFKDDEKVEKRLDEINEFNSYDQEYVLRGI